MLRKPLLALALLLAPASALAHHSFAMFDHNKEVELKSATVVEWQWTNPHCWLMVTVPNGTPNPDKYALEGSNPAQLRRQGYGIGTFAPGDKLTVYMSPLVSGTKGGALLAVVMPDGKMLGQHLAKPVQ
jgi:hypothetical protein